MAEHHHHDHQPAAHEHAHEGDDEHAHDHAHSHGHAHVHGKIGGAAMYIAVALTLGFAAVEAVAGLMSGSLALVSDAGHMVTDAVALGIAAFAAWISRRPPSKRHSFGFMRAEVLAAVVNSAFMMALIIVIAGAAVMRLFNPHGVNGETVTIVAGIGLVLNLFLAWLLSRGESNLNSRAALLHVIGDVLGSLAALLSGLIVIYTGVTIADPLFSIFICALILFSTLRLLRDGVHALMEGVPLGLDLADVGREMARVSGVCSVHDLHIWALSSNHNALSAHVVVEDLNAWDAVLQRMLEMLTARYRIKHVTLQPEVVNRILYTIAEPTADA
jgi:cobalt-zinc-cadmium efflux system protein